MPDGIEKFSQNTFEQIKHVDENGVEYWSARELYPVLEYGSWRKFCAVIEKAVCACQNSGQPPGNNFVQSELFDYEESDQFALSDKLIRSKEAKKHFRTVSKRIIIGKGAERLIGDVLLSRYACYLIVQNGDPSKPVIAAGQTYFAVETRKQEILEEHFRQLDDDGKRLYLRQELREHNKLLVDAAKNAGVETNLDYAVFQNSGYKGLYGGLDAQDIHERKGLKKSQKILDHMGHTELAANLFRATQTEEKLRRDQISGKREANDVHYAVGAKVRKTIEELGGTMPEDLPTPQKSISQIEKEHKKINSKKKI